MAFTFDPKRTRALINRTKKTLINHLDKALESAFEHGLHVDTPKMMQAYQFYKSVKSPKNIREMDELLPTLIRDYFKFVRSVHLDNKSYKADLNQLNQSALSLTSLLMSPDSKRLMHHCEQDKPLAKPIEKQDRSSSSTYASDPSLEIVVENKAAEHYVKRWLKGFYNTADCNFERARAQTYTEQALLENMQNQRKTQAFMDSAIITYHTKMSLWFNEPNPLASVIEKAREPQLKPVNKGSDFQNGRRAGYSYVWNHISSHGELRPWLTKKALFDKYNHRSEDFKQGYYQSYKEQKQRLIDEQKSDPKGFAEKLKKSIKKRK